MTRKILSIILCLMLVLPAALPVHAAETLYHVDISIDAPKAWSAPCFYTNSVKNEYGNIGVAKVVSVAWYEYNPNRAMTASDTFQAGKIYEVTVRLEQVSGVLFAKNTFDELYMTANINGMTATVTPVYGNSHQADVSLRFPELGGYINYASVNDIDAPVTGNTPDYSGVLASTEYKFMPQNEGSFAIFDYLCCSLILCLLWTIHHNLRKLFHQFFYAANVIVMMVGEKYGLRLPVIGGNGV